MLLTSLLNALPGAVTQGLIWGLMAIGVYITYRILDVADLTVDGSLALGGAACVMLIRGGVNPWLALLIAALCGAAAGFITGTLHTRCGIPAILAGILTQLALYSVNLRIMGGKANQAVSVDKYDLIVSQRFVRQLSLENPMPLLLLVTALLIAALYWFFGTEIGCGIRATGANARMARAQGINTQRNVVVGLALSNGGREHGPRRHRHRTGRRHHRREPVGQGVPQLRPSYAVGVAGRYCLLPCFAGGLAAGPEHQ